MSRFRLVVITAIAAAGLGINAGPAIAAMAQNHVSHPATSRMPTTQRHGSQVTIPNSHCGRGGVEATIFKKNCADETSLNHGRCSAASGKMAFSPAYSYNGCGERLWLFTGNLTGTRVCISPVTGNSNAFKPSYHYYQITKNKNKCP